MNASIRMGSSVTLRWAVRALAAASIGIILLFLIGEGFDPGDVRPREWALFACFPVGLVIGLGVGCWREIAGGLIASLSLAAFYLVYLVLHGDWPRCAAFLVLAFPGILFLALGVWRKVRG